MVPRAPPRTPARMARRRLGPAEGGRSFLRSRRARARSPPRPVPEPVCPLPLDRPPRGAARMNIRRVTIADEVALRELWEEFEREVPEPDGAVPETWDEEWADVRRDIDAGAVFIAEDEDGSVGT